MLNQLEQTPEEYQQSIDDLTHNLQIKNIVIVGSIIIVIALSICYYNALKEVSRYKAAYEMQRDARLSLIDSVCNPQYK